MIRNPFDAGLARLGGTCASAAHSRAGAQFALFSGPTALASIPFGRLSTFFSLENTEVPGLFFPRSALERDTFGANPGKHGPPPSLRPSHRQTHTAAAVPHFCCSMQLAKRSQFASKCCCGDKTRPRPRSFRGPSEACSVAFSDRLPTIVHASAQVRRIPRPALNGRPAHPWPLFLPRKPFPLLLWSPPSRDGSLGALGMRRAGAKRAEGGKGRRMDPQAVGVVAPSPHSIHRWNERCGCGCGLRMQMRMRMPEVWGSVASG